MKHLLRITLMLLSAMTASAQSSGIDKLFALFHDRCVDISCTYSVSLSNTRINGEAVLNVQGDMYKMEGNGLLIYCDGKSVWAIDDEAKEAVIEPVSTDMSAYLNNPAVLFVNLSRYFDVKSGRNGVYELVSKVDCGVESAEVTVRSDGTLTDGVFNMSDGCRMNVKVSSMKQVEKKSVTFFQPQKKFSSEWIVTDLR